MATGHRSLMCESVELSASVGALVGVTHTGGLPSAGGTILGVTRHGGVSGDLVPADTAGLVVVMSGGAISAGAALEVAADGRFIPLNAGVKVARARTAANAAGQQILVKLLDH